MQKADFVVLDLRQLPHDGIGDEVAASALGRKSESLLCPRHLAVAVAAAVLLCL